VLASFRDQVTTKVSGWVGMTKLMHFPNMTDVPEEVWAKGRPNHPEQEAVAKQEQEAEEAALTAFSGLLS
jgi:hypothetical protein